MGPRLNKRLLDAALAEEFKALQAQASNAITRMCLLAAEIRHQNLAENGRSYDSAFEQWWLANNLDKIFGGRPNFTKYAEAGDAIENVRINFKKHTSQLPTSMSALYEIAQLSSEELNCCLEHTYKRKEITADPQKWTRSKSQPLINPQVTAAAIRTWRKNWRTPKIKSTSKEHRRLKLLSIKMHDSFWTEFDKNTGEYTGKIKPANLISWSDEVAKVFESLGDLVLIEGHSEALTEKHDLLQKKWSEKAQNKKARKASSKKIAPMTSNDVAKVTLRYLQFLYAPTKSKFRRPNTYIPHSMPYLKAIISLAIVAPDRSIVLDQIKNPSVGTKEKYLSVITSPTPHEFEIGLLREYQLHFGTRRALALLYRCRRSGIWGETKKILAKGTENRGPKKGTVKFTTLLVKEQELKLAHRIVSSPGPLDQKAIWKAQNTIEDLETWLPRKWSDEEITKMFDRHLESLKAVGES